jgi:NADH-quinone oxidoreductase subunit M
VAFLSATGVILAASYMLILYKKVFLGVVSEKIEKKTERLNIYEVFTYSILAVVIFIFGIKPNLILDFTSSSLERIIKLYPISIF